jgi:NADH-quinone oxidoreductase subunit N
MTAMTDMNWMVIYPEALLLLLACVVAIADLFVTDPRRRATFWMTQATFALVAALHLFFYDGGFTLYGMQGMVVTDPMGHLLAFFATIAMMATVAYAQPYIAERDMLCSCCWASR